MSPSGDVQLRLWTTRQVAQALGVDRKFIFRVLIPQGDLHPVRLTRSPKARLRFRVEEVEALIRSRTEIAA